MKNKWIKKGISLSLVLCFVSIFTMPIEAAAGVSVSASASSVNVGDSVTFTVSGQGAGYVNISGAVNTSVWLDNSSASFTVSASQAGSVSISVSGVMSDYDNPGDVPVSGGASVTVVAPQPAPEPTPTPTPSQPEQTETTQKEPEKEAENEEEKEEEKKEEKDEEKEVRLASLTTSVGSLTPAFSADVDSYVLKVGAKVDSVTLKAKAMDGAASVSGDGEIKLDSDTKEVSINVTNGSSSKTYKVQIQRAKATVTLSDSSNGSYELISEDLPSLEGYSSYTIKIDGREYPAMKQENGDIVLVYCMNDQQIPLWYQFDEKASKIVSLYNPVTLFSKKYVLMSDEGKLESNQGYEQTMIEVDGKTIPGYQFTNDSFEDYNILYLKEDTNEAKPSYYQYEKTENTLQKYSLAAPVTQEQLDEVKAGQKTLLLVSMVGVGFGFISLMASIGLVIAMRKRVL